MPTVLTSVFNDTLLYIEQSSGFQMAIRRSIEYHLSVKLFWSKTILFNVKATSFKLSESHRYRYWWK